MCYLRGQPALVDKARVGVVLDVVALDEVLQVEQRRPFAVLELQHVHLEDVHLTENEVDYTKI